MRNLIIWQQAVEASNGDMDQVKIETNEFGKRIFRRLDNESGPQTEDKTLRVNPNMNIGQSYNSLQSQQMTTY
jgi:hypothetical protein